VASAVGELRYYSGRAVSGSLAYDLDRELRERELSHAGEMPRHRDQVREQPKVRRVASADRRPRRCQLTPWWDWNVIRRIQLVLMSYIQLKCFCRNRGTAK
jgi:hypothetical protein